MCSARRDHSYATSAPRDKTLVRGSVSQQGVSINKGGLDLISFKPSTYHRLSIQPKRRGRVDTGLFGN